jgi:UDP-N-acetylmuramoyl-L-alanine---L-glutamate ligase
MQLNELDGKRVVVWGSAREASAFVRAVRARSLDVDITVIDELSDGPPDVEGLQVLPFNPTLLRDADCVFRSPGVSIYKPEMKGLRVITATGLWFAEPHSPVIAVTGTKGKSTTAALIAHVLNEIGIDARLAGNIGRAPLDFVGEPEPQYWVVELSSFQIADANAEPDIAVLTSLDSDHLDWHGSQENYINDKLRLFEKAHVSIANVTDPGVRGVLHRLSNVIEVDDTREVPQSQLFGPHNAQLIRLALTVFEAIGVDTTGDDVAAAVKTFAPLPHRLEPVAEIDGVLYINDSLSTNPIAATAAVKAFTGRPITLLVGGYDRGLNFDDFGAFISGVADLQVLTLPDCGDRIAMSADPRVPITHTEGLAEAVRVARTVTPDGGVVLLAPAAASFGHFKNYAERGDAFKKLVNELTSQ